MPAAHIRQSTIAARTAGYRFRTQRHSLYEIVSNRARTLSNDRAVPPDLTIAVAICLRVIRLAIRYLRLLHNRLCCYVVVRPCVDAMAHLSDH